MTMRNFDRFIPGEEIEAVEQWRFGSIDTAAQVRAAQLKAREAQDGAAQSEVVRQQAFQEGFTQGIAQGRVQAQAELDQQMQAFLDNQAKEAGERLATLFSSAQVELVQAEQSMAQEVLALACALARQVLQQELTVNPNAVLPVLREALAQLGADCKAAVVKLNPEDIDALGEQIQSEFNGIALNLRADATVQQGGCVIESAGMVIDGTLAKRWQRVVASLGLSRAWEAQYEPD
jgi:flagellar assembly protein FliH